MNIPEIRFDGFDDKWKKARISDISRRHYGGGTPSTEKPEYWTGTIPWIQSSDLVEGQNGEIQPLKFITHEAVVRSAATIVPKDSIAVVNRVGVGKVAVMRCPYTTSQDFISLSDLTGDVDFHAINIQRAILRDIAQLQGSTIKGLTGSEVLNKDLFVPSQREQRAIGVFFRDLDTMIADRSMALQYLHHLKSSMLVKMFPQTGNTVPEVRFVGFAPKWEESTLGELGTTYGGLTGKNKYDFGHGDARYITYMNVFNNAVSDPSMVGRIEEDPVQREVRVGDVLFTTSSETPEEVGMSSVVTHLQGTTYLNSFCFGYRPNRKMDLYFLASLLRSHSVREQFQLLAQGISRFNISKTKSMEIVVSFPSLEEQQAIGRYFRQLDKLIDLEKQKLTTLTKVKTAFLDKMFV